MGACFPLPTIAVHILVDFTYRDCEGQSEPNTGVWGLATVGAFAKYTGSRA